MHIHIEKAVQFPCNLREDLYLVNSYIQGTAVALSFGYGMLFWIIQIAGRQRY